MDPTANLTEQLELAARILQEQRFRQTFEPDTERLAELVEALNSWITKGGFLPAQWNRS